ncbi:MAG: DEAD/DEAH box helicase [Candidatus Micrarchaeales archaeon]|nr:DEAD/DEAH box helicase [Candidatus Micrarchaeales archaeon]
MALQPRLSANGIELNREFRNALAIIEGSGKNLFITGRAGAGKSTLLAYLRSITSKRIAILAPTGVAALNVGGQTIHSFCRFKPDITPETVERLSNVSFATANMYKSLDTIVIDEISMVRADLLDCLDRFMRLNGRNPDKRFGGVQMIFVGDLYQLPPVVTEGERGIFEGQYKSPYFFDSRVFDGLELEFVELKSYYRHSDPKFIELLNAIRDNTATEDDLEKINRRFDESGGAPATPYLYITLTTTNSIADRINNIYLEKIPARRYEYRALITGKFGRGVYPADDVLCLKEGAQVMMLNNDSKKRWVNGSLGRVVSIGGKGEDGGIVVELEDGKRESVAPYTWETSKLSYDSVGKKLVSTSTGSFTQYPLMLAWAVTIHKSQGKTFDHVIIDVGDGTFAHGQLYVALSRCTTLEGIVLRRKLQMRHIITDARIAEFHRAHFQE